MYNKKGISSIAVVLLLTALAVPATYVIFKRIHRKAQSAWQLSIEQIFAAKKSGQFKAKDKNGAPIILEWLVTNLHEPEYARIMHQVADLVVQAFVQVDLRELRMHPEMIGGVEEDHPYKQLEPLFRNGAEAVDWTLVQERLNSTLRSDWQSRIDGEVARRMGKFIVVFVVAKDFGTNKLLGFVEYLIDADCPYGAVELEPLAIEPEEQKRGLGKLLVSSIFRVLPGVTYIWLGTSKTNDIAIKAYEAWGFVQRKTDTNDRSVPMEYRAERSDILQKVAQNIKN